MRCMNLKKCLGKENYRIIEVSRYLLDEQTNAKYFFLTNDRFSEVLKENITQGMKIYWQEILFRAHMSAYAGLKRLMDWVNLLETVDKNFIAYATALRGLIECSGDTYHGLSRVSNTFADNKQTIVKAFNGDLDKFEVCKELEDILIHFLNASQAYAKEVGNKEFNPQQAQAYISLMEKGTKFEIYKYYKELCEFVHPSAPSLGYNFSESENGYLYFNPTKDEFMVNQSLKNDRELIIHILQMSLNPISLLIKTINLFKVEGMYSKKADSIVLQFPAWEKIIRS